MLQRKANAEQFYLNRREIEDEFEKVFERTIFANNVKNVLTVAAPNM